MSLDKCVWCNHGSNKWQHVSARREWTTVMDTRDRRMVRVCVENCMRQYLRSNQEAKEKRK
jgi:hypothetical protein